MKTRALPDFERLKRQSKVPHTVHSVIERDVLDEYEAPITLGARS